MTEMHTDSEAGITTGDRPTKRNWVENYDELLPIDEKHQVMPVHQLIIRTTQPGVILPHPQPIKSRTLQAVFSLESKKRTYPICLHRVHATKPDRVLDAAHC